MDDIWFSLETKVRGLIKELLEPSMRRTVENKEILERMSKNQEIFNSRLDELDMNLGKFTRKVSGIDDLTKRITEFDSSIRLMEVRFNRDREEIKTEVHTFGTKIINFEEYLSVFDHMKEAIRNDITNVTHALQVAKNQNEDRFQMFKDEFRDKLMEIESRSVKFEVQLGSYEKNIKSLGREIGDSSSLIQTTAHTSEEIKKKNKEILKSFKNLKKNAYDQIDKLRNLSIKQMSEAQVVSKRILDIVNDEIPVKTKLMLNETLFAVFNEPHQKHFMAQVFKEQLLELQKTDLTQEINKAVMKLISNAEEILQVPLPEKVPELQMQKSDSNSKVSRRRGGKQRTIFVVRRENGIESDSPMLQEAMSRGGTKKPTIRGSNLGKIAEESRNESSFTEETNEVLKSNEPHERKSEMISLKDYDIIKDEIQLARYNTLIRKVGYDEEEADDSSFESSVSYGPPIDYLPLIEQAKNETIVMISELQTIHIQDTERISNSLTSLKEEMDYRFRTTKVQIDNSAFEAQKNLQELGLIINQALAECTSAITSRKRDQSDFAMEIKALHQKAENFESQYGILHERMDSINRNMDYITEALRIINLLYKQDEYDRESIALMGYKETKGKAGKSIISIEKQCLSCTGQASVVLTAFKIACLAYSPSLVTYRDTVFSRKELIDVQAKMLNSFRFDNTTQISSIIEESKGSRCRTASNIKINRPLSVPSSNFTLQTPRVEISVDSEFPRIRRVPNITLSSMHS